MKKQIYLVNLAALITYVLRLRDHTVTYRLTSLAMASSPASSSLDGYHSSSDNEGKEVIELDCLTVQPVPKSAQREASLHALIKKRDKLLAALDSSVSDQSDLDTSHQLLEQSTPSAPPEQQIRNVSVNGQTDASDINDIISFLDKNFHSIYPEWTSPLLYPPENTESSIDITKYASKKFKKKV